MHPLFAIPALADCTRRLAQVASGREPPDLILRGVRPLCVFTEKILPEAEVWIASGRIAAIKPAGTGGPGPEIFDGAGAILAPGLIDPHIHIESSMMTACAYAEAALLNGTTTIFCDSHEIANVCDRSGVEWMLEDARQAPLNIFLTVPSTVPATTPEFETAGGDLTPEKIGALFDQWPEAVALGEKMDFVAVAAADPRSHAILAEALRRGRPVSGHVYGREMVAPYAASGVTDTHEAVTGEIAEDLLRAGVWIFLRGGNPNTPWHSLPEAIRAVTEKGCSPKRVCLCTDDRDADDLFIFGLDWVQREARRFGLSPALAWSMGSLHPSTRFGLDGETGSLGLGRRADLALIDDSGGVLATWLGGKLAARNRQPTPRLEQALADPYRYPPAAYRTVHLPEKPDLVPPPPDAPVIAHLIDLVLPGIETRHGRLALPGGQAWAEILREHHLCHLAVIERHGRSGAVAHGLLRGFGLREGAVASTVGHDAHNLIVAGTDAQSMALAVETLRHAQGGVCVVRAGKVAAHVPLPIAGLMSDGRAGKIATETAALKAAWTEAGCRLPYMGFNLLPLAVIPELRITDRGLVDATDLSRWPLFEPAP
ncbi:MAG: adenine deaminase C-terminal domain-containing protein [Verrucomicrobiia bacterium]